MPHGIGMEEATIEAVGRNVAPRWRPCRHLGLLDTRRLPADRVVKLPAGSQTAGSRNDATRHDHRIPDSPDLQSQKVKPFCSAAAGGVGLIVKLNNPARRSSAPLAVCQGQARQGTWMRSCYQLQQTGLCEARQKHHQGRGRSGGLTLSENQPMKVRSIAEPLGTFISFGTLSGPIPRLMAHLSQRVLFFTRPTLMTYTATSSDLAASARALFGAAKKGVKIEVNQRYALRDAKQAHIDLEARKTTGSTVLET